MTSHFYTLTMCFWARNEPNITNYRCLEPKREPELIQEPWVCVPFKSKLHWSFPKRSYVFLEPKFNQNNIVFMCWTCGEHLCIGSKRYEGQAEKGAKVTQ